MGSTFSRFTLTAAIAVRLFAQQEPSYPSTFYAIDANGTLIELEQERANFRSKVRALPGYATVRVMAEVDQGRSPVRLSGNTAFVVRGRSPLDPATRYELRELKASKHRREFVLTRAHASLTGAESRSAFEEGDVPIRLEAYGADSYRITPEHPLAPGEYALSLRGGVTQLYCFGINR